VIKVEPEMTDQGSADLPHEMADRIIRPFAPLLNIKAATGSLLFLATFAAVFEHVSNHLHCAPARFPAHA
jgi:hypothetical protein